MKLSQRTRTALAGVAVGALFLTGCSQSSDSSSQKANPKASQGSGLPANGYKAVPASDLKDGGTVTFPIGQLPANYNYGQADGALVDLVSVLRAQNWGGPIRIKEDGTWEVDKNYASSVKLVSEDPQVVEIKLNPQAKFENGDPITVKDYQASLKAFSGKHKKYQVASTAVWEDVKSVDQGSDKFDVKMTFKTKNADWPSILIGQMLPASVLNDPTKFNKGFLKKLPPATGPFKQKSIDQTNGVITMERNPEWWGEKPKLDTVVYKVVSQASQAQAYANKEIDVVDTGADGDSYKTAQKRSDGEVQKSKGTQYTHLTINASKGPLADLKVREAIGHAVNREIVAQAALGPVDVKPELMNNNIFIPGQKGYKDNTNGALKLDQAMAKKILDDDGWKMSGGVRKKDGKSLTADIVVPADTQTNAQRAQQVQRDLNAVGFKINLKTVPVDKYFVDYVNKKDFGMVSFTWQGTAFPISSSVNIYYPKSSAQNYFGISSPEIGKLSKEANSEFDQTKRLDLANQMDAAIWKESVLIPFAPTPYIWGVKKSLKNIGATQFQDTDWTQVGYTK